MRTVFFCVQSPSFRRRALSHETLIHSYRMNHQLVRAIVILIAMSVGYSILSNPGPHFSVNVGLLKNLLLYVLLAAGGYALYQTFNRRNPPGV